MRRRPSTALALVLGSLVLATGWTAATEAFTLRFGASGGLDIPLEGPAEGALRLGQCSLALPGDDPCDVPSPPPPPGGGGPLLYVPALDPLLGQYWHDFRPQAVSQAWELDLVGMGAGAAVTLRWRLEEGSLGGLPLRLLDRKSGVVLVVDMSTTTELLCQDTDRALLVLYGEPNRPPLARCDQVFMLTSDGSTSIPFEALLANDYDPDGDVLDIVGVEPPTRSSHSATEPGSASYGTTTLDPAARSITYALPTALPADWTGQVAFRYTLRDSNSASPAAGSALVLLAVSPDVVQDPDHRQIEALAGEAVELTYTLRHTGTIRSLLLEYSLPLLGSAATLGFWQFLDGSTDATDSAPVIDPGYGPDGQPGGGDDSGVVRLDFGTAVPPSGSRLSFRVLCPVGAAGEASIEALARYRLGEGRAADHSQTLARVSIVPRHGLPNTVAGPGGTVTVESNAGATAATAHPEPGYRFVQWTHDGAPYSSANPLILTGSAGPITLMACFEALNAVPPSGDFLASVGATAVTLGRGLWNVTGTYRTTAHGAPLTLLLEHDAWGRLMGNATYQAETSPALQLLIRGSVRSAPGAVMLNFVSRGSSASNRVGASLGFTLAVDPSNRRLTGPMTGTVTVAGTEYPISAEESPQAWSIAPPMDGTWSLRLADLELSPATVVNGTAVLRLSCGTALHFLAKGRLGQDGLTSLLLGGVPGDLEASAMALGARIRTLEDTPDCGQANLLHCRGEGYGQTLAW